MRIAILNSHYYPFQPGGAERSVRSLAESLASAGHDVSVVCLGADRESTELAGVRVERLPIRNGYLPNHEEAGPHSAVGRMLWHIRDISNRRAAQDLTALLRTLSPDVLHTNNLAGFSTSAWDAANALSVPVVHTTRDFYLLCPKTTMMRGDVSCTTQCVSCRAFSANKKRASKRISEVVGISRYILERHLELGCFTGIASSVIYNSFAPPLSVPKSHRALPVLGFIGRLAPAKGLDLLIDALRYLDVRGKRFSLNVAGDGDPSYVAALKARAQGLPVTFLGHVEPAGFFPDIDITIVPSIWNEPLGRVVIESMAFGRPVVVTPVGGMPELVKGIEGEISAEATPSALATAIVAAAARLETDADAVRLVCIERASAFAPASVSSSYLTVYERAIARGACSDKSPSLPRRVAKHA